MLDKQLGLHTHLSKLCIYAIPVHHTLMRQLFRQRACESIGGDATEFVAVGLTWLAGPQRGSGRQGGISHNLMNGNDFSHFMVNNEF